MTKGYMNFFNRTIAPTLGSNDGTYYVKNGDMIELWLVSFGKPYFIVSSKISSLSPTNTIIIDESITNPSTAISGDVNGSIITAIRAGHRRCLAKYLGSLEMAICYLRNDNSSFYHDSTAALLDGIEGDVMLYRPVFYYKYIKLDADRYSITFSLSRIDETFQMADECLIGAYEAYAVNNKLYSVSDVQSSGSINQTNFKAYARARGTGYQLIDWDMHKMIPWLFYAIYGNRNCQAICGSGTNSYEKATGQTNGIGNVDTTTANGNSMSVNFLGLDNCWGNKYEFLDNVIVNPDANNLGVWRITDTVTGEVRNVQGLAPNNAWEWTKRMIAGEHLDIIVSEAGMSATTGFCDGQYLSTALTRVVLRSGSSSGSFGGVAFACASIGASGAGAYFGSRLAFRGKIVKIVSVAEFKAIQIIN
ncbi:MAG: hypothetical protein PHG27_09815 [Massilibacteroides sp.]|nr:hypothetical protein [Massilibacteroides sp.]